jgi:ubiquinone/menaquinone biosynthesis C-methylase UbiE
MPIRLDPEGAETRALFDFVGNLAGKHVLEVGCGDGRLTWRYADKAAHIIALDPDPDDIALAIKNLPPSLSDRVEFQVGTIQGFAAPEAMPARGTRFDIVILSWSL